jgi:hypothetical protein
MKNSLLALSSSKNVCQIDRLTFFNVLRMRMEISAGTLLDLLTVDIDQPSGVIGR